MLSLLDITFLLKYVTIIVLVFAIIYAARFISITKDDPARKPWEYLMYAVAILLVLHTISFLNLGISEFLKQLLTLLLTGLLLFVFVTQDFHMKKDNFETLTRKELIPIQKKIDDEKKL